MRTFIISLLFCSLLPLSCFANALEVPEAEDPKESQIVRIYKGQAAQFDGALVPFNTLKRYEEFRLNYEIYKKDYENYGPIKTDTGSSGSDKWAFAVMGILSGAILGVALFTDTSRETKNMALTVGSLGVVTSFVILVW